MSDNSCDETTSQLIVEEIFEAFINETSTGINQVIDSKMSSLKEVLKEKINKILQDDKQNILEKIKKLRNRR